VSIEESSLALVTTEALLDELDTRFDHTAFVGRTDNALGEDRHRRCWRWAGDGIVALGLLVYLNHRVLEDVCEHVGPDPCEPSEAGPDEEEA